MILLRTGVAGNHSSMLFPDVCDCILCGKVQPNITCDPEIVEPFVNPILDLLLFGFLNHPTELYAAYDSVGQLYGCGTSLKGCLRDDKLSRDRFERHNIPPSYFCSCCTWTLILVAKHLAGKAEGSSGK